MIKIIKMKELILDKEDEIIKNSEIIIQLGLPDEENYQYLMKIIL